MSKILASTTCTHCGKEHDTVIDLSGVPRVARDEQPQQPKVEVRYPSWMPYTYCSDGNCALGGIHPNKNYTRKPSKVCKDCGQTAPGGVHKCAWCRGEDFEELSDEALTAAGIPLPEAQY